MISNHLLSKMWHESTYPFRNLAVAPFRFVNGLVISSHTLTYMWLLIMLGLMINLLEEGTLGFPVVMCIATQPSRKAVSWSSMCCLSKQKNEMRRNGMNAEIEADCVATILTFILLISTLISLVLVRFINELIRNLNWIETLYIGCI